MTYPQAFFLYTAVIKLADAVTVVGVWHLCWYLRFTSQWVPLWKEMPVYSSYSKVSLPLALVFTTVFHIIGTYRRDRIHFGFKPFKKILHGSVMGTLIFIAICYFLKELDFSRIFLAIFPFLAIGGLFVERLTLHLVWKGLEAHIIRRIRHLVVGTGKLLQHYISRLEERRPYPIQWIGRLGNEIEPPPLSDIPFLGDESHVETVLKQSLIDTILISYPSEKAEKQELILAELGDALVTIKVIPDFGKFNTFAYHTEQEWGVPLLQFNQTPTGTSDMILKRLIDIAISSAFMLLFSPLYLVLALIIKFKSQGPVMYKQVRIGADGRTFTLYKFRTMQLNAEERTGPIWATPDDKRTTTIGKWLRRLSLDELPQLYNVLKGDMSVVGPRPERPVFVEQFRKQIPKYMLRHKMKSGITGWAQVNGLRGNTSLEERIKYDLFYVGHWSHYFDFKILCLTLVRGFVNRHAY